MEVAAAAAMEEEEEEVEEDLEAVGEEGEEVSIRSPRCLVAV